MIYIKKWLREPALDNAVGVFCFLFFASILVFRGGHSAAIAFFILLTVFSLKKWISAKYDVDVKTIALYFLVLSVVWSHSFDSLLGWSSQGDYFLRYFLGACIILALSRLGLRKDFLFFGVATGVILAGIYAAYQFNVLGRANGYTNAIRFGNIAMLMGVFCLYFSVAEFLSGSKKRSIFFLMAFLMGMLASILSLSRGGWAFLGLLPLLLMLFADGKRRWKILFSTVFAGLIFALISLQVPFVEKRIDEANQEVTGYFIDKEKYITSSVGARLEQWQLSWKLGMEKPIFGWGYEGVDVGRKLMVERGEAHITALNYPHTHNEFLEMWATRGIVGVIFLVFIYVIPIYVFYPTKKRLSEFDLDRVNSAKALYISGVSISLAYFTFGLSDVFLNLSISHVFFMFSIIFIMAAIQGLKYDKNKKS